MNILAIFSIQEMQSRIGTSPVGSYRARTREYSFRLTGEAVEKVNQTPKCSECGKEGTQWHLIAAEEKDSCAAHLKLVDKDGTWIFWRKRTKSIVCMHCLVQQDRGYEVLSLEEVATMFQTDHQRVKFRHKEYDISLSKIKKMMSDNPVCACCGKKADHWELRKRPSEKRPYLVLVDEDGMIFTRDHIIPRSRYLAIFGTTKGRDSIDNSQTMCSACNFSKADALPLVLPPIKIGSVRQHQLTLFAESIADNNGQSCQECDSPTIVTDEYLLICTHCGQRHRRFLGTTWSYWSETPSS